MHATEFINIELNEHMVSSGTSNDSWYENRILDDAPEDDERAVLADFVLASKLCNISEATTSILMKTGAVYSNLSYDVVACYVQRNINLPKRGCQCV